MAFQKGWIRALKEGSINYSKAPELQKNTAYLTGKSLMGGEIY